MADSDIRYSLRLIIHAQPRVHLHHSTCVDAPLVGHLRAPVDPRHAAIGGELAYSAVGMDAGEPDVIRRKVLPNTLKISLG